LVEIGPRFSLVPIKLFSDFLGGETLWANPYYAPPSKARAIKISNLVQRRLVKKKSKEMVSQQRKEDKKKEESDLFNKEDPE
jgi:ribosome biogenesis protein BRX1